MIVATWTYAGATIFLALTAIVAAIYAKRQHKLQVSTSNAQIFAELSKELSDDDASYDRGLVRECIKADTSVDEIKKYVKAGRKLAEKIILYNRCGVVTSEYPGKNQLIGIALERTIARFDRMAIFLLDDKDKLRWNPPLWFWTMVNDFWCRLHTWIEYRQTPSEDSGYYQKGYAIKFSKLVGIAPR